MLHMANKIVRKETTTVVKEFDKKGKVVKETTITDVETFSNDPVWTFPYTYSTSGAGNIMPVNDNNIKLG